MTVVIRHRLLSTALRRSQLGRPTRAGPGTLFCLHSDSSYTMPSFESPPAVSLDTAWPMARRMIELMRERVSRDEGGTGIGCLMETVKGDLFEAAKALVDGGDRLVEAEDEAEENGADVRRAGKRKGVAILTGFPCLMDHSPPTETDGPPGAFAIAKACIALGRHVHILTDEVNAEVLISAAAGCGLKGSLLSLEAFPPAGGGQFGEQEAERLLEISNEVDCVIAIERPGPGADGKAYTMRGYDMSEVLAPLHMLLDVAKSDEGGDDAAGGGGRVVTIGIGDRGNEIGMGKVLPEILRSDIMNKDLIACTVTTDHLIVASVSDWGGYALAGAMAAVAWEHQLFDSRAAAAEAMLPSSSEVEALVSRMVEAGARDGVTGEQALSVDGMPLQVSLDVLEDIRHILLDDSSGACASGKG